MQVKKMLSSALVAGLVLTVAPSMVFAIGGASGPKNDWQQQGKLGSVKTNPYGFAPLTAVITNGGYVLSDVTVRIVPKAGGQEIKYKVADENCKLYGGIPVFGLYANHKNSVEVTYTKKSTGIKPETVTETYQISTGGVGLVPSGLMTQSGMPFEKVEIKKAATAEFADRIYLINNVAGKAPGKSGQAVWNNPMGGALEWNDSSCSFMVDTKGEIRWYFDSDKMLDYGNIYKTGIQMGFRQNLDGAITWGYGQRYVKYDVMGREIFNRQLPLAYNDFSHSMDPAQNGNYLLRVGSSNTKRPDGKM